MIERLVFKFILILAFDVFAHIEESEDNQMKDGLYIHEVENKHNKDKVLHA